MDHHNFEINMRINVKKAFFMIELMVALWLLTFILLGICGIYINIATTKIRIEKKIIEIDYYNRGEIKDGDDFGPA